jgi:hypothetical protein
VKCPPDRGSSDCVTDRPASLFSTSDHSISSSPDSIYVSKSVHPRPDLPILTNYSNLSRPIPCPRGTPSRNGSDLSTPPLTPDDDNSDFGSLSERSLPVVHKQQNDALDFLMMLFPHQGLQALPYAKSVSISAPNIGAAFEGVVLELPGKPKTLYVDGKSAESISLRERCAFLFMSNLLGADKLLIASLPSWIWLMRVWNVRLSSSSWNGLPRTWELFFIP